MKYSDMIKFMGTTSSKLIIPDDVGFNQSICKPIGSNYTLFKKQEQTFEELPQKTDCKHKF